MALTVDRVPDGSFPHCVRTLPTWTRPTPPPGRCCASSCSRTTPGSPPSAWPAVSAARPARRAATSRSCGRPVSRSTRTRGPYGGYRLGSGVRPPPVLFSATEALGLVMAVLDGHHDAGDGPNRSARALGKVVRALPASVAAQVQAIRRTTAPAPDRGAARPDPATTIALVQASSQDRRVRLRYRSEPGTEWVTEADPWAVVVRHGRWYLLCRAGPASRPRIPARPHARRRATGRAVRAARGPGPGGDARAAPRGGLGVRGRGGGRGPARAVRRYLSPALGRLDAVDDEHTSLTGSTGNPTGTPSSSPSSPLRSASSVASSSSTPSPPWAGGSSTPAPLSAEAQAARNRGAPSRHHRPVSRRRGLTGP